MTDSIDVAEVVEQYGPGVLLVIAWELRELRKAAQDVARALGRPLGAALVTPPPEAERPRTVADLIRVGAAFALGIGAGLLGG